VAEGAATLRELADLDQQLKERNLLDNKHTEYTYGEADLLYHELAAAASARKLLLENQKNRRREKDRLKAEADALGQANDQLKRRFAEHIGQFAGAPHSGQWPSRA
jgi:hypothetical protein